MSTSDELRSRLVKLAGEMHYGIELALIEIRKASSSGELPIRTEAYTQWKKGLTDALTLLRTAEEAQRRFKQWCAEVIAAETDECGLTAEERAQIVHTPHPREI